MTERNSILRILQQPSTADVRNSLMDMVTNRATFFPVADYADGSTRWAVPGALYEPAASWNRMLQGDTSPQNAMTVAGAGMAGSLPFARNALLRMDGSLLGTIPAPKAPAKVHNDYDVPLPDYHRNGISKATTDYELANNNYKEIDEALKDFIGPPQSANVYHGASNTNIITRPHDAAAGLWTSNRPDIADTYSAASGIVAPARATFQNPVVIDAGGAVYYGLAIPGMKGPVTTDTIARRAAAIGADGVIFRDVRDAINGGDMPSDVWHAIKKQTVQSRFSPDYLYSGGPGAASGALLSMYGNNEPER